MKSSHFLCAVLLLMLVACSDKPRCDGEVVCRLEVFDIETGSRTVVAEFDHTIEAPNWSLDGKHLIYNSEGQLWSMSSNGKHSPKLLETGDIKHCNNDHCLSFDGHSIGISSGTDDDWRSRIWTQPLEGGEPRLVTPNGPSYLHGWSPDGQTLTYCAERNGEFDVYTISATGGDERRLTDAPGLDDGPEYTPDGQYIWFNSVRTGLMQLWRMKADGSEQEQMTFDENRNSWFAHISPDGQKVVFIAYKKGDLLPGEHLPGKHVELLMMPSSGGDPTVLTTLYGGQGTLNVNSWAPDSHRFAFVSYVEKEIAK